MGKMEQTRSWSRQSFWLWQLSPCGTEYDHREKVTAAYAVQTTRDEMQSTFSRLNDPTIKERIHNVSRISSLLLEILGEDENKIDLGEEPVILAADALSLAD